MKKVLNLMFYVIFSSLLYAQDMKIKLTEHKRKVECVAFSNNGKLMVSGAWDGNINIYKLDSSNNPVFSQTLSGHLGAVTRLWFHKNNRYLVSCSKDFTVKFWNIDTPYLVQTFSPHAEGATMAYLDPSAKFLITSGADGTIKMTNIKEPKKIKNYDLGGAVYHFVISKDFKFFYAAIKGLTIKKMSVGNAELITEYKGHSDEANYLDLSNDGKFLASASNDKTVKIWDLATSKNTSTLTGHEWKVTSVKWTFDGQYVISSCNNGVSILHEIASGKQIKTFGSIGNNSRELALINNASIVAIATHFTEGEFFGAILYNTGISVSVNSASNEPKGKPSAKSSDKAKATNKPKPKQ